MEGAHAKAAGAGTHRDRPHGRYSILLFGFTMECLLTSVSRLRTVAVVSRS